MHLKKHKQKSGSGDSYWFGQGTFSSTTKSMNLICLTAHVMAADKNKQYMKQYMIKLIINTYFASWTNSTESAVLSLDKLVETETEHTVALKWRQSHCGYILVYGI